jgi:hypothetical protein
LGLASLKEARREGSSLPASGGGAGPNGGCGVSRKGLALPPMTFRELGMAFSLA